MLYYKNLNKTHTRAAHPVRVPRSADVYKTGNHMLSIVTGPYGSGKTTQLISLLDYAEERCISTAGVVCPAVFEAGEKIAIDALLLPDETCLRLATLSPDRNTKHGTMWKFDPNAFVTINNHLDMRKAKLLIIDELGPQEFEHGRGYTSALRILDEGSYENAFVVIRQSLLEVAQERWGPVPVIDITQGKDLLIKAAAHIE